jgi:hypothetical protein
MKTIGEIKQVYLDELALRKSVCITKATSLQADNKLDEANFEKIKVNVFDIFTTLFNASEKKVNASVKGTDLEKYNQFCIVYLETFNKIPSSWRIKLEYSIKNNLIADKVIEEIKLEVADSLKNLFNEMRES